MRGVIDEQGYSPFWESLGKRFFAMEFSRADYLCGTGQKAFIAALMPKHPLYIDFLSPEAQAVIGKVHPQTAPARTVLEKEGFRYLNYIDIFRRRPDSGVRHRPGAGDPQKPSGDHPRQVKPRPVTGRCAWWRMNSITSSALCWCMPIRMATP